MMEADGIRYLGPEDLKDIPARKPDANKGTYGHVLVAAGCRGMSGAAYFAALGAYRSGAGLVQLLTPSCNREILQIQIPEAIVSCYEPEEITEDRENWEKRLGALMNWSDVVILGPGLGKEAYVKTLVEDILQSAFVPVIMDADALNAVAQYPSLSGFYTDNIIITPHIGEMSRLTGKSIEEILEDQVGTAAEYRDTYGITCLLKSDRSVTAASDGMLYRTNTGTPALAKGGTGDVLTGIIAGMLCLGFDLGQAAAYGSFVHGLAGRAAAMRTSAHGALAREIADAVPLVMRQSPGITF